MILTDIEITRSGVQYMTTDDETQDGIEMSQDDLNELSSMESPLTDPSKIREFVEE